MKMISKLISLSLLLILFIVSCDYALGNDINWYSHPTDKDKSILEYCVNRDECHKLIHNNDSISKELIVKWIDEIRLIHNKIKQSQDKYKGK